MDIDCAISDSPANSKSRQVIILDCLDGKYRNDIASDIQQGMTASQKYIPCKYFYDARGSRLFEEICQLPEYYPTLTELSILKEIAPELMETFANRDLVELGSGANLKIRILLDAAGKSHRSSMRYIPMDISESTIAESSADLIERYPELQVMGVVADFTSQLDVLPTKRPLMLCFLGSTIGNMSGDESISFLRTVAENIKSDDKLLIGFDMVKPREIMEAAYNDSRGITSEFNKNILNVLNRELNADFDSSQFDHMAFFNEDESRIEMHLRANSDILVRLGSIRMEVKLKKGETIHTENSRKFTGVVIEEIADKAGLSVEKWYSDSDGWFSLVVMCPYVRLRASLPALDETAA
jgi:L-histidine N-alpha-methyltransferase